MTEAPLEPASPVIGCWGIEASCLIQSRMAHPVSGHPMYFTVFHVISQRICRTSPGELFDRRVGPGEASRRPRDPHGIAAGRVVIISGGVTPVWTSHIHTEMWLSDRPALARDGVKDACRRRAALAPIRRGMIGMIRYRDAQDVGERRSECQTAGGHRQPRHDQARTVQVYRQRPSSPHSPLWVTFPDRSAPFPVLYRSGSLIPSRTFPVRPEQGNGG